MAKSKDQPRFHELAIPVKYTYFNASDFQAQTYFEAILLKIAQLRRLDNRDVYPVSSVLCLMQWVTATIAITGERRFVQEVILRRSPSVLTR